MRKGRSIRLRQLPGGWPTTLKTTRKSKESAIRVAHEIRNQYVLAYSPTNQEQDGTYSRIRVDVKGQGKLNVRTRTGYYAPTAVGIIHARSRQQPPLVSDPVPVPACSCAGRRAAA